MAAALPGLTLGDLQARTLGLRQALSAQQQFDPRELLLQQTLLGQGMPSPLVADLVSNLALAQVLQMGRGREGALARQREVATVSGLLAGQGVPLDPITLSAVNALAGRVSGQTAGLQTPQDQIFNATARQFAANQAVQGLQAAQAPPQLPVQLPQPNPFATIN